MQVAANGMFASNSSLLLSLLYSPTRHASVTSQSLEDDWTRSLSTSSYGASLTRAGNLAIRSSRSRGLLDPALTTAGAHPLARRFCAIGHESVGTMRTSNNGSLGKPTNQFILACSR